MPDIVVVRSPVSRATLRASALDGEMVKAVVDLRSGVMAVGGDLHADEEDVLLQAGAAQDDLWGINLYLSDTTDDWIEYDSMINLRPSRGNRSRGVDDLAVRQRVRDLVLRLVLP